MHPCVHIVIALYAVPAATTPQGIVSDMSQLYMDLAGLLTPTLALEAQQPAQKPTERERERETETETVFDTAFSCSNFNAATHFANYQRQTNLPPPVKHASLTSIKNSRPAMNCFVETGTNTGSTVAAMLPLFNKLYSVENFAPLHQQSSTRFENNKDKVQLFLGSSRQHLANMGINSPDCAGGSLLWLDGHFSGAGTGGGTETSPVLDEVKTICASKFASKNVVVVDDIREFSPTAQNSAKQIYPSPEEMVKTVCASNTNAKFHWKHDSLIFWFEGPDI